MHSVELYKVDGEKINDLLDDDPHQEVVDKANLICCWISKTIMVSINDGGDITIYDQVTNENIFELNANLLAS